MQISSGQVSTPAEGSEEARRPSRCNRPKRPPVAPRTSFPRNLEWPALRWPGSAQKAAVSTPPN